MSVDDVPLDVLGAGREPDRRRLVAFAIVLAVLLAMAVPAWYVDHQRRDDEFAAISQCATRTQAAFDESTSRLSAMAEYVRPSLTFAPEPTLPGLYGMVAHEAATVDDGLQRARTNCADLGVLGWHRALQAALRARLVYVDAQLALVSAISTDGQVYFQDRSRLEDLQAAAASAMSTATPGIPW